MASSMLHGIFIIIQEKKWKARLSQQQQQRCSMKENEKIGKGGDGQDVM